MAGVNQGIDTGNLQGAGRLRMIAIATEKDAAAEVGRQVDVRTGKAMVVLEEKVSGELLGVDILLTVPAVGFGLGGSRLPLGTEVTGDIQTATDREFHTGEQVGLHSYISVNTVSLLVVDTLIGQEVCVVLTTREGSILLKGSLIFPIIRRPDHVDVGGIAPQAVHDGGGAVTGRCGNIVVTGAPVIEGTLHSQPGT